jgi:hypothetical protein
MLRKIILILFVLLLATPARAEHIQYFGYYYGMDGIYSVSSYVNTMFVDNERYADSITELANRDVYELHVLNSMGVKGILSNSSVFFDRGILRADWLTRWNTYWKILYPYLSMVVAFYPMDEPDLNVSMSDYITVVHAIKTNLDTVNHQIAILMVISSPTVIRIREGTFSVPQEVNWLGFDEYWCWIDCSLGISIPEKFQILVNNAKQNPDRKVVVVPGAVVTGTSIPTLEQQQQIIIYINNYYLLCRNEPLCIGVFPFLWKTLPSVGIGLVGADNMPIVQDRLRQIGTRVKSDPKFTWTVYLPINSKNAVYLSNH